MSAFKDITPQIVKLNANNYSIWKFKMEMILTKEDLFDLIEDDPPAAPDAKYLKRDRQARALINLYIEDSQIINVKYETTAKATWNKLKAIHERTNLSSKLFLLRKLYATKMPENGNMNEHITQMLELIDKLRDVGEEIKDQHIAALLLVSVPKSYDTLITALEARPEAELTPELIKNKLTDEYNRRKEQNLDRNLAQAFKTNLSFKRNTLNNYEKNNSDKYCTFCRRNGHSRDICYKLKNRNSESRKRFPSQNEIKPQERKSDRTSICMQIKQKQNSPREPKQVSMNENLESPAQNGDKTSPAKSKTADNSHSKTKLSFLANSITEEKISFYLDSGSSQHLVNDAQLFSTLNENVDPINIIVADGKTISSQGSGKIYFNSKTKDGIYEICLENVYYIPQLECNLLSVKKITEKGFSVNFNKNKCSVIKDNTVYLEAFSNDNGLYKVIVEENKNDSNLNFAYNCNNRNCIDLWHKRLGHRNCDAIKQLVRENLADGIQLDNCQHSADCVHCIKNKLSEFPYPKEAKYRAKHPLDLVHSDLCGPMQTPSVSGKHYFLTLVDDFSRYCTIYLLSKKDEVLLKLKEYIGMMRNKFGRTIKTLRSDNGGEYIGKEIEDFLNDQGIVHQLTVPYSPQQNGVAERKNRSLTEMTRCLLSEANLPQKFWGEAVITANYIQNRLPTKANKKTPFELWTGRRPDLSNIRTFGSRAFAYIHKSKRGKLDEKAIEGIMIGYDQRSKGYRIYISDQQVIVSRTVRFIENDKTENTTHVEFFPSIENTDTVEESEDEIDDTSYTESIVEPRRSKRNNIGKPPERLSYMANEVTNDPKSLKEALSRSDKNEWLEAIEEEMNSLKKNHTWDLVELPKGKKPIGCKWTFKRKLDQDGNVVKHKARLVAKGYKQKFGIDFDETFAPVVKHTTIRAFLAAAVYGNMQVKHVDIKTAFLHGDLEEDIFMDQPEGYINPDEKQKVCKLNKSLYGLKQAAKAWNQKIAEVLQKNDFQQSMADNCLFRKEEKDQSILVILYVDDLLIASRSEEKINETINILRENFEVKDLGNVKNYLGINIQRKSDGSFEINQKSKIEDLLEKVDDKDRKPTHIPMDTEYTKNDDTNKLKDNSEYRQAIGALLYIATISRPDVALAVNKLSRKNESPSEKDWTAVKKLIMYLNTTKESNLIINSKSPPILSCYTDADWGSDVSTRSSTSGNVFLLGNNTISWFSKRQSCIALSSCESEYVAAAQAAQEIQWLIHLLKDLGLDQNLPIKMYEDNKSCITLAQTAKNDTRIKHIDIKYHYIRHLYQNGTIELDYCKSKANVADIFTKPLPRPLFSKLRGKLNISSESLD